MQPGHFLHDLRDQHLLVHPLREQFLPRRHQGLLALQKELLDLHLGQHLHCLLARLLCSNH
jgi:hypothetical protein